MKKPGLIYQNGGFMVFDKPAGLITQGPGTMGKELWQYVRDLFPNGNIAHRIDRFTSGGVICGETRKHVSYLMVNWHKITKKVYLALIPNPEWNEQIVDTPLQGKTAVTRFTVLERKGDTALVMCELIQNGRQHQIRKHLKSIDSAIIGDRKYGGRKTNIRRGQFLHAWRISFLFPGFDWRPDPSQPRQIQSPIPDDFRKYAPELNWDRWNSGASAVIQQRMI